MMSRDCSWRCHRARRSVGGASSGQAPRLLWMKYVSRIPVRFGDD